jgi:hypothetical protein
MLQYAACGDPDAVCGTFGLLDFREGVFTMGQLTLTFNLFAMIMFLLTDMRGLLSKAAIGVGLLACSVAHSGHQTVFLMVALALVGLLHIRLGQLVKLSAILAVVVTLTATVSTVYVEGMKHWYQRVTQEQSSPKKVVTIAALDIMSSPSHLLFGVGMGQYGSRAALISSGEYLSMPLPAAVVGESVYFHDVVWPANDEFQKRGEGSVFFKPYYSVLNLVVEFGVPAALLILAATLRQLLDNRRLARSGDKRIQAVGVFANVGLVFLILCCFIENYLELPQAIFMPVLLYVLARSAVNSIDGPTEAKLARKN